MEGQASMCNALQKQMQKFTFYIPELQAWGNRNRWQSLSGSWQCCQMSGTNTQVVLHRTSDCRKNSEYGNTATCGCISQHPHSPLKIPSLVQDMEQEYSGPRGRAWGHYFIWQLSVVEPTQQTVHNTAESEERLLSDKCTSNILNLIHKYCYTAFIFRTYNFSKHINLLVHIYFLT